MPRKSVDYVNELYLKSLCIRVKNRSIDVGTEKRNKRINQLLDTYIRLLDAQYPSQALTRKKNRLKDILKARIIALSELTRADDKTYNIFGAKVLLMIRRILTKPQFSNYTYKDEFYSDATFKVVKYIYNFDHKKISKITGNAVNSFSYITQIIHNSIIFVINKHKKDQALCLENVKNIISPENIETFYMEPSYERSPIKYTKYLYSDDDVRRELEFLATVQMLPGDTVTLCVVPGLEISLLLSECQCRGISYNVEQL